MITALARDAAGITLHAETLHEMKKCRAAGGVQIAVYSNQRLHHLSADYFFEDENIAMRLLGRLELPLPVILDNFLAISAT